MLGNKFRKIFGYFKGKKKLKKGVEPSFLLFMFGIVILLTVAFMSWIYSYMYTIQKQYDDSQAPKKIIYQEK